MIRKEDLMHNGEWIKTAGDLAIMFPMLEMTGGKFMFIEKDVLCIYNEDNVLNDTKVNPTEQQTLEKYIRTLPKYSAIKTIME